MHPEVRRITILFFLCVLAACSPTSELPYYHTASFTPLWKEENSFSLDTLHRVSSFLLTDQHGNTINNDSLRGKIYVANFFFTSCPGICPRMTLQLHKVQQRFADHSDIKLLSHTVMPWLDSVPQLNEFASRHQINYSQWKLVTGRKSDIYLLARQSYFAEEVAGFTRDSTEFVHTEHCVLVDKEGHLRGIYNGTLELEVDRMIEDIQILLASR